MSGGVMAGAPPGMNEGTDIEGGPYRPAWVAQTLQGIMIPNFILYIKKENLLKAALVYVEELRDHHAPMLRAANMHELRLAHDTHNMIIIAEMKLKASIMRQESRCSHYRLDYPELDNKNWQAWINIYKVETVQCKWKNNLLVLGLYSALFKVLFSHCA